MFGILTAVALSAQTHVARNEDIQSLLCAAKRGDAQNLSLCLAAAGNPEGFIGLGFIEETARPANDTKAFAYYLAAAELGSARAQWRVGVMLDEGVGVPSDPNKALFWLQKFARQDLGAAWASLGVMRLKGRGTKASSVGAYRAYRRAIRFGEPGGFAGIGAIYARKSSAAGGIAHDARRPDALRNHLRAVAWYRVAESYGHSLSREKLAGLTALEEAEGIWVDALAIRIRERYPMTPAWDDSQCPSLPKPVVPPPAPIQY